MWGANTFPVRKYNSRTFHLKVRRSRLFQFFRRFPQINVGGDSTRLPPLEDAHVSPTSPSRWRVGHDTIPTRYIYFSVAHHLRTPQLSLFGLEQFWYRWPSGKFSRNHPSEDKARWNILMFICGVSHWSWKQEELIVKVSKRLPMEGFDRWRVLTNKVVEWSSTAWSVIVWESSRSQQLVVLQMASKQTFLLVQCGLRMNQAEAGRHVTP